LSELFDADLQNGTLTRVSQGYEGGLSEQPHGPKRQGEEDVYGELYSAGTQSPSFSGDGRLLAFSSTASNLVYGDGNTPPAGPLDGSDAFVVQRLVVPALPTPQSISPAPQTPTQPAWTLGATARSRRDGTVLLFIRVPGQGVVRAGAVGVVRLAKAHSQRRSRAKLARRTVAAAGKTAGGGGATLTTLVLRLAKRYSPLASHTAGLSADVRVTFAAPGHPTLRQTVEVTFKRRVRRARAGNHHGVRRG